MILFTDGGLGDGAFAVPKRSLLPTRGIYWGCPELVRHSVTFSQPSL